MGQSPQLENGRLKVTANEPVMKSFGSQAQLIRTDASIVKPLPV